MNILVLDSGVKSFVARLDLAHSTTAPVFTSHYYDSLSENIGEKEHDGLMNGTSYVTIVASPVGNQRVIKEATFYNGDSIEHTWTLALDIDGVIRIIYRFTLGSGATMILSKLGADILTVPGVNGITPHIGENGNWYIGETDTGVPAQGNQGEDGLDGEDGDTPYIGENGNWWIGLIDTGVKAGASNYEHPTGFEDQPTAPLEGFEVLSKIKVNVNGHTEGYEKRAIPHRVYGKIVVPLPPSSGTYALGVVDGEYTWIEII